MKNLFSLSKLSKPQQLKIIIFMAWLISSIVLFIPLIGKSMKELPALHYLAPEERASYQIYKELFDFLVFCKSNLPDEAQCFFYNFEGEYAGANLNNFMKEITRIKTGMLISYFLYPLKIYNLAYNNMPDILEAVDFILIHKTTEYNFPGFTIFARYDENSLILKRRQ